MKKFQGAEATVKIGEEVIKERKEKKYRHPEVDEKIRTERTDQETRIMQKARKYGVNTPEVLETEGNSFKMQKIEGKQLKEIIEDRQEIIEKMAEQVAKMHDADIIHGDLTTSNAVYTGKKLYLIDFGLAFHSERTEDKAVDIHLLKQVFRASHTEELWERFAEKYREEGDGEVVEKVPEIEERVRYK
jgi:Kae1-associated kinase Bud32